MTVNTGRKFVIFSFVSIDVVMQSPGGLEEDISGEFEYGGWTVSYLEDSLGVEMDKQNSEPFELLLGRKTYDIFDGYWPKQETDVFADVATK